MPHVRGEPGEDLSDPLATPRALDSFHPRYRCRESSGEQEVEALGEVSNVRHGHHGLAASKDSRNEIILRG
jgi:hypothetical protein